MVMEDGRCLLDVINDPQALNEFMQNDALSGNGQGQEQNTVADLQHTYMANPAANSNQPTNDSQGNVVMATGTMATYGHLVQKTTHPGQEVPQQTLQLSTSQAYASSAPLQTFQVPQGAAVLSQGGNVVVQPGNFVQGTVSNGSSQLGTQGTPAPNRTLQPQFGTASSLGRTSIVQNAPQQKNAAGQQPTSFQAVFEKAMLQNKANRRQAGQQNVSQQPLPGQQLVTQQQLQQGVAQQPNLNQPIMPQNSAVAQQPNLNQPIMQQNSSQPVLQQPISQQHLQQTFSQQPLQQNISQQPLQQNISQQSVGLGVVHSGSLQQSVVGQSGTKTISSLQALHNLNIVSHPSNQSSSVSMAMPSISTATVVSSATANMPQQRTIHIQPKPPVAISPKLLPGSRPLVNISPKTSLPGSQTVLVQGANAQGVAPNINIANLVTLPGLRAPQGVLVQAQSLAQRISNVQRIPITTSQTNVASQQQSSSPQTNILLQAAQQSNLMPTGPVQNVMQSSSASLSTPQANMLQQHSVTLVQRASPGGATVPQQQAVTQHTVPMQIAPQTGNRASGALTAPVFITSQSSPSPSNLTSTQTQQLRPASSQQPSNNTSSQPGRTNLAALSIAQQIQDQAAAQSRSGQAAIIPQGLLQKGAKILPANVAQQLLQQRKVSEQPPGTSSPQVVAINTSQPTSTVTTVTMTTVQPTTVQHTVTSTSTQPQVLVTTGAGGQPRLIVTLPQQPLPPQFQQREEKNLQLYQQALRIQKERQLQPGVSAGGQVAAATIVTTQVQAGQQQGMLVPQQGIMGQQQSMMVQAQQQVSSAGTVQPSTMGQQQGIVGHQGAGTQQNFVGQQVLSGIVQQHGIVGQQQGIVGQQQGIVGQQQSIVGQQQGIVGQQQGIVGQQQGIVGQQQQGVMGQQHSIMGQPQHGVMGHEQGIVGQQLQGIVGQQEQGILGQQQQQNISDQQQQGIVGQQQGTMGQQQGVMAPQRQRILGQQQQSIVGQQQGIVGQQQQGIMGQQQQSIVGQQQQQGIISQQQGIMGQQQQGIVGQQQQGIMGQQQQGIMGQQQQGIVGQQQQGIVGQQQGILGQQQQGIVGQQQQGIVGQQQQGIVGQQQGIMGQQQQGIVGQQQQGIVGQQQGTLRRQLNIATQPQAAANQQSPAKTVQVAPRQIAVSSAQQPIVTRAATQPQSTAQNPGGVTVVRQPVAVNVQQGKQFITLTLQQQQHLAAIQAKLRTIVTPGKQLSPQEKQVVQQLQVLQSRILQQAKAQTQALAQNAAGQASLAQAAQKMTPIAQKPVAPASTQGQGQGTIQQQRQQLNELLKTQTQVIRTTQAGVTSVVSASTAGGTGQPTLVKLQPQGSQGPAAVIQLTPQQKATLQQIQQQLKTLSPQQQQQFLKQQQHLILQLKNSKIAISPAALSAANAGNAPTAIAGQQLVTVLKQQPGVQTIAGKLVQPAVHGIKRPAPQPLSKTDLIKNRGKQDQQFCLKPDYKTPFRSKDDAIRRLLPFHIHTSRDIEQKEIDKAEVTLGTVSQSLVEKYHKMRDKYHHLLLQESMRVDPSAEMVMLWRVFVHEEKSALAQEKKLAVESANGTPVAAPSAGAATEPAADTPSPASVPSVVGTATTAYLQPTRASNSLPKTAVTVTTSRTPLASSAVKPPTSTTTELNTAHERSSTTQDALPVARGGAADIETKESATEDSDDEVDMVETLGPTQPATSFLSLNTSSIVDAVKATSPARLKSESEMAVASLLGEDSGDIDILNSDIGVANPDLPEEDAVQGIAGDLSPMPPTVNLIDAANDFDDDFSDEPDSLNEQVQSAINSILELQGRGPLDDDDSPTDMFNPFSQDPPSAASSEPKMEEDNALDEAVKSILF